MRRFAGSAAAAEAEESQRADLPIKGGNGKKGWSRSTNLQALESNSASIIDGFLPSGGCQRFLPFAALASFFLLGFPIYTAEMRKRMPTIFLNMFLKNLVKEAV